MPADFTITPGPVFGRPPRRRPADSERRGEQGRSPWSLFERRKPRRSLPPAAVGEWLATITKSETRRAYRRDVTAFCRFLGIDTDVALCCCELHQVGRYAAHLKDRVGEGKESAATARRRLAAVSSLYNHLNAQTLVPTNPTRGVPRPATPKQAEARGCRVEGCLIVLLGRRKISNFGSIQVGPQLTLWPHCSRGGVPGPE